jgi:DNA-binding NtrC family response regulator
LCQRAGGLATVESNVGLGTTVRLFFPAIKPPPESAVVCPPASQPLLDKTVLLVEDNDEVAGALTLMLEELGCVVTRLDRADAAWNWLVLQPRAPDLLLTDVVMPGAMDGLALAQQVRSTYPTLDVILMSGYAEQIEMISSLGFEIVPKPCSAEMLSAAFHRVSSR